MPLEILAAIVAVGLTGIWAMLRLLGYSRELSFADEDAARRHWLRHRPAAKPRAITLARDGRAALVQTPSGLYLLWVFGLDSVYHDLTRAELRDHPGGLRVVLHDFAAPHVTLTLTKDEAAQWRHAIERRTLT